MKIHEYNQMMAYLTRPSYVSGGRVGFFAGGSLQPYFNEIKKLFLEGKSAQEIVKSNPQKFKAEGTVAHALDSMKKGLAPVKISASEIKNRITKQSENIKKVKGAYDDLVKNYRNRGLSIKPGQAALMRETGLTSSIVSRAIKSENLNVDPRSLSPEVQEAKIKTAREALEKKQLRLEKLKPVYKGRGQGIETPKVVDLAGPEKLKKEYLDEYKKRLKYPARGRAYRAAVARGEILSNPQLTKRFGLGDVSEVEKINSYLMKKENLKYAKGEVGSGQELRRRRLKITQPGTRISGKGRMQFHHIMPIGGEVDLTSKDVTFINKKLNASLQKYNTPLNRIADAISDNLNKYTGTMDSTYLKKIEPLNAQAAQIVDKAKNELPKKYRGLIGFNKITPVLDENATLINTSVERIGIDEAKTPGGVKGPKISLSQIKSGSYTPKQFENLVNQLNDAPDALKLKIGGALGCRPAAAEGGRIGLQAGSGLMQCISSKLDKDPQGTLAKVANEVPETKGPIRKALGMTGKAFGKFLALAAGPLEAGFMGAAAEQGKSMSEVLATPFVLEGAARENRIRNIMGDDSYQEFLQYHRSEADPVFYGEGEATGKRLDPNLETLRSMAVAQVQQEDDARKEEARQFNLRSDETMFNQGGRVGLAKGPKDPSKRVFLKGVAMASMIPIIGKYFKLAAPATKAAAAYTGPVLEGLSSKLKWVQLLAKRLWNEGDDVTETAATAERQIVRRGTLESGDEVDMVYDVNTKDVHFEVAAKEGAGYESASGAYEQSYQLGYRAPRVIEEGKQAGKKTKAEVEVAESRPHQVTPEDVELDGDISTVEDAVSDLTELEAFAKKKTVKEIHKKKGTTPKDINPTWEPPDYDWDDVLD